MIRPRQEGIRRKSAGLPGAPAGSPGSRHRPRGMALLMALAVVMLLTVFMSEYFFATGLELRGMTTYKESEQARGLAKAVLKVVMIGLQMDEVAFYDSFRQVEELLTVAALPWKSGGLLLELKVAPQDHLYNLNEMHNLQQGEDKDLGRWNLFRQTLADVEVPPEFGQGEPEVVSSDTVAELYAALYDWIDSDNEDYIQFSAVRGAEADAYFNRDPEIEIKNGMLDQLSEIRLVKGVQDSRIPWPVWNERFTALPRFGEGGFFYPEKINVNLASHEDIVDFLTWRRMDPELIQSEQYRAIQEALNKYIDNADSIADAFVPAEGERDTYTPGTMADVLKKLGFTDNYGTNYLFSTVNEYYRISLVTEVNEVRAHLEALVHVPRDKSTRLGASVTVLWWTLR